MKRLRTYSIAVVQMDSQGDKRANLKSACLCIDEAAASGAKLVSFPEVMSFAGEISAISDNAETVPGYTTDTLSAKAKEYGIYIHSGSFYEAIPGESRSYNTSVIIDPDGKIISVYRKLHTFDVTLPDGTVCDESADIRPGDSIAAVDTPLGKLGMAICYDIRFPEIFRLMALEGAQLIFTPANFTMPTGKDHWEALLRARAIENGSYIVAADQVGIKPQFTAYGSSMVVDPWGTVIARAGEKTGIIYAEIDLDFLDGVRGKIPSLKNRRPDVYTLNNGD